MSGSITKNILNQIDSISEIQDAITLIQITGKKANQEYQKRRCEKAKTPNLHREEANLSQKDLTEDDPQHDFNQKTGHDDQLH
jgi:hypothetical protein